MLPHEVFRFFLKQFAKNLCIFFDNYIYMLVSVFTSCKIVFFLKKTIENLMWLFYRNFHEACKIFLQVIHYHIQLKLCFG